MWSLYPFLFTFSSDVNHNLLTDVLDS
jgi:hypothetical protein